MFAINMSKVTKSFDGKESILVLDKIDLQIRDGEFICLLGPSGCGKSVLLWLLAGFEKPTKGKILIYNNQLQNPSKERIMIFQDYALFPWRTVKGNIEIGLEAEPLSKQSKEKSVLKYLKMIRLTKFKNWPIHKLSGGMQQRVALARALVANPKILLMDEPFAALDSQHRAIMRKELIRIWKETKKTILFVTHSISEAIYLADRIYVLTSRPAKVKEEIEVGLPRPRDPFHRRFVNLKKKINKLMIKEVEDTYQRELAGDYPLIKR